jgi:hypothetical protein
MNSDLGALKKVAGLLQCGCYVSMVHCEDFLLIRSMREDFKKKFRGTVEIVVEFVDQFK